MGYLGDGMFGDQDGGLYEEQENLRGAEIEDTDEEEEEEARLYELSLERRQYVVFLGNHGLQLRLFKSSVDKTKNTCTCDHVMCVKYMCNVYNSVRQVNMTWTRIKRQQYIYFSVCKKDSDWCMAVVEST